MKLASDFIELPYYPAFGPVLASLVPPLPDDRALVEQGTSYFFFIRTVSRSWKVPAIMVFA
jgi:hypothetical protein